MGKSAYVLIFTEHFYTIIIALHKNESISIYSQYMHKASEFYF